MPAVPSRGIPRCPRRCQLTRLPSYKRPEVGGASRQKLQPEDAHWKSSQSRQPVFTLIHSCNKIYDKKHLQYMCKVLLIRQKRKQAAAGYPCTSSIYSKSPRRPRIASLLARPTPQKSAIENIQPGAIHPQIRPTASPKDPRTPADFFFNPPETSDHTIAACTSYFVRLAVESSSIFNCFPRSIIFLTPFLCPVFFQQYLLSVLQRESR